MKENMLKKEILKHFMTQKDFASDLNWPQSKLTELLKGRYEPKITEVNIICTKLKLSDEIVKAIFFDK